MAMLHIYIDAPCSIFMSLYVPLIIDVCIVAIWKEQKESLLSPSFSIIELIQIGPERKTPCLTVNPMFFKTW